MYTITRPRVPSKPLFPTKTCQWCDEPNKYIIVATAVTEPEQPDILKVVIDSIGIYWVRISSDEEGEDTSIISGHRTFTNDVVTKTCADSVKIWIQPADGSFSMYYEWTREKGLMRHH